MGWLVGWCGLVGWLTTMCWHILQCLSLYRLWCGACHRQLSSVVVWGRCKQVLSIIICSDSAPQPSSSDDGKHRTKACGLQFSLTHAAFCVMSVKASGLCCVCSITVTSGVPHCSASLWPMQVHWELLNTDTCVSTDNRDHNRHVCVSPGVWK